MRDLLAQAINCPPGSKAQTDAIEVIAEKFEQLQAQIDKLVDFIAPESKDDFNGSF